VGKFYQVNSADRAGEKRMPTRNPQQIATIISADLVKSKTAVPMSINVCVCQVVSNDRRTAS
jgi:hypothetical protein